MEEIAIGVEAEGNQDGSECELSLVDTHSEVLYLQATETFNLITCYSSKKEASIDDHMVLHKWQ
eukprot:6025909-Ditylum_brightwellii.AAC.1